MYNYGTERNFNRSMLASGPGTEPLTGPARKPIYDHPNRSMNESAYVNPLGAAAKIIGIKQSVEYLEKSVREKEILLNELQHRIKNDLNMILGLINIEMEKNTTSRSERLVLNALKNRIYTIASVYRQLCPSNVFGIIDLRDLRHRKQEYADQDQPPGGER